MKKHDLVAFIGGCAIVFAGAFAAQGEIALFEFGLNDDGVISSFVVPSGSVFDTSTGLGTLRLDFTGAGLHTGYAFFDHEMSEVANTFFNELGTVSGVPSAGQSWEIDEPGFVFGDIFDNFQAGTLDNSIGTVNPDDVSMAMGWAFILGPGETGRINFLLTTTQPVGFFLRHYDPSSSEEVFLASSLSIQGPSVPENGTVLGFAALSAVSLFAAARRLNPRRHPWLPGV